MGYFKNQQLRNLDLRTSDDDYWDKRDGLTKPVRRVRYQNTNRDKSWMSRDEFRAHMEQQRRLHGGKSWQEAVDEMRNGTK